MRKVIFVATVLTASSATAGEIVWRSPTSGTLTTVSDPAPPLEPEQPAFAIRYEPLQVAAGTFISITPSGDTNGYVFGAQAPLPPGLVLDAPTGKITGFVPIAGIYSIAIRAEKDGSYSDLVMLISVS